MTAVQDEVTREVRGEVLVTRHALSSDFCREVASASARVDSWRVLQTAASPERSLKAVGFQQHPALAQYDLDPPAPRPIFSAVSREFAYYAKHVNSHASIVNKDTRYTLWRGGPGCYCGEQVVIGRILIVLVTIQAPTTGGALLLPRKKLSFAPVAGTMLMFPAGIDWSWSIDTIGEGSLISLSTFMHNAPDHPHSHPPGTPPHTH